MHPVDRSQRAFSLMEVTTALGVISFALIALLGVFPLGLENSRACVSETRATQLVHAVTSTLLSEPFTAAPCFSTTSTPLNLAELENWPHPGQTKPGTDPNRPNTKGETPAIVLYASYEATDIPHITRDLSPLAIYKIELRFRTETILGIASGSGANAIPAPIVGSTVLIRVTDIGGATPPTWSKLLDKDNGVEVYKKGLVLQTQAFIPAFTRLAYSK